MNLGSYNYLGFAAEDPYCTPRVQDTLQEHGWSLCSPRAEAGDRGCLELFLAVNRGRGDEGALTKDSETAAGCPSSPQALEMGTSTQRRR